jgi:hypothetical protein
MGLGYHYTILPESYKRAQIGVALALIEGHAGGARQSVCAKGNRSELWILEDFGVPACVAGARLVCAVRA